MDDAKTQYLTYQTQLKQVEALLLVNPTDAKSLSVKKKLVEVIALYAQLLGPDVDAIAATTTTTTKAPVATSSSISTSSSSPSLPSSEKWPNGTICEFSSPEGQWFPVRIKTMRSATSYNVFFYGFGREQDVDEDKLRQIAPLSDNYLSPSAIQPGLQCEAKYYEDGQWYAGRIEKLTEDGTGVHINFTLYGNTEEVPKEWLRIKKVVSIVDSNGTKVTNSTNSSKSYKPKAPKILVIPDNLKAKEGDTDKERANKRKRMRSIQNKNRFAKKEIESNQKQASWQTFQKRATKKLKRGVSNQSQFTTKGPGKR